MGKYIENYLNMPQTDRDDRELWSTEPEPHMQRRREIMKKHPEVK